MTNVLSGKALSEEIEFFQDYCGWSEKRIEEHLGLANGTLGQRRRRHARRADAATGTKAA